MIQVKCWGKNEYNGRQILVRTNRLDIYYSYSSPIAFRVLAGGLVVSENTWGTTTTGKHLNQLDKGAKGLRLDRSEFLRQLEAAINFKEVI